MSRLLWVLVAAGVLSASPVSAAEAPEAEAEWPLAVALEAVSPPRLKRDSTLRVAVRWRAAESSARQAFIGVPLEVLVNLPPGFAYVSGPKDLVRVKAPAPANDPTGPWTTYRWTGTLSADAAALDQPLAWDLTVKALQPGENWVFTAALHAGEGPQARHHQTVMFATVSKDGGEFHPAPRRPTDR